MEHLVKENTKKIYPDVNHIIIGVILCLVFLPIGLLAFLLGINNGEMRMLGADISMKEGLYKDLAVPIGVFTVYFFGSKLIYLVYRLVLWKPSIILEEEGIIENTSINSLGLIRWDEICNIDLSRWYKDKKCITITLQDTRRILTTFSTYKRIIIFIKIKFSSGILKIKVPPNMSCIPIDELYNMINLLWSRKKEFMGAPSVDAL